MRPRLAPPGCGGRRPIEGESSMIYVMVAVILAVLAVPYMVAIFTDDHHAKPGS